MTLSGAVAEMQFVPALAQARFLSRGARFSNGLNLFTPSLTGTDSPFLAWSFWVRWPNINSMRSSTTWASSPTNYLNYTYPAYNLQKMENQVGSITGPNAGKTYQMQETTSPSTVNWNHYLVAFRSNTGNLMKIYRNRVDVTGTISHDELTPLIPTLNGYSFYVGSDSYSSNYDMEMADFWLSTGYDLIGNDGQVSAATLNKFITTDFLPVNLGANGSAPTGSAPLIYLHRGPTDAPNAFATNRGTGGVFQFASYPLMLGDGDVIGTTTATDWGSAPKGVFLDNAASISTNSLTVTNSPFVTISFWAKWATKIDRHKSAMFASDQTNFNALSNCEPMENIDFSGGAGRVDGANDGFMQFTLGDYVNGLFRQILANDVEPLNNWNHYLFVFRGDTPTPVLRMFRNRVEGGTISLNSSTSSFTPNLGGLPFNVGHNAGTNPNTVTYGAFEMADFYMSVGYNFFEADNTVSTATLNKFITPSMAPASMGANGESPSGSVPAIFLHRAAGADPATFATNRGTGGTFAADKPLGDGTAFG